MARTPKVIGPSRGFVGEGTELGDPPPAKPYALKRGSRAAVPDRTREPVIGPACGDTRSVVEGETTDSTPRFTDELRSGIEMGTTRGNAELPKTTADYANAVTEAHGQATRPSRPGAHR